MGLFADLQQAVATELAAVPEFSGVTIRQQRPSDPLEPLQESLQGLQGVSLLVLPPMPYLTDTELQGLYFPAIDVEVRIFENVHDPVAGLDAWRAGELVSHRLHLWLPNLTDILNPLLLRAEYPWKVIATPQESGRLVLEVRLTCAGTLTG